MTDAERQAEIRLIKHTILAIRDRHDQELTALLTRLDRLEGEPPPRPDDKEIDWKAFVENL